MDLLQLGRYLTFIFTSSNRKFLFRFNKALIPVVDQTLEATSRRFGRRTEQETSPNMKPIDYSTSTFRASYFNPKKHDLPNFRTRNASMFDTAAKLNVKEKSDNLMTGYESNRQLWDGTTWRTEKHLHTD